MLISQIDGSQSYFLFSPSNISNLYGKPEKYVRFITDIDISNPDLQKYPNYSNANYVEIILEKNDSLYVPFGWWYSSKATMKTTVERKMWSSQISKLTRPLFLAWWYYVDIPYFGYI